MSDVRQTALSFVWFPERLGASGGVTGSELPAPGKGACLIDMPEEDCNHGLSHKLYMGEGRPSFKMAIRRYVAAISHKVVR